jgi:hypothetical protein
MTEESSQQLDGGCTCGAVRYRLTSSPLFVHCCHCRWCQRETGSAFVINALIETERVPVLRGSPADYWPPASLDRLQSTYRRNDA